MELVVTATKKAIAKGKDLLGSRNSGKDYVNVPKEEENLTQEDYEFGGKGYMLDEENVNQDGGEDDTKNDDFNRKQKTSSLQASWNIGNLITGKYCHCFKSVFACVVCLVTKFSRRKPLFEITYKKF